MSPEDRQIWEDDEDALRLAAHASALEATETGERAERALWRDRGKIIATLIRERDEARAEVTRLQAMLLDSIGTVERANENSDAWEFAAKQHERERDEALAGEAALRRAVGALDAQMERQQQGLQAGPAQFSVAAIRGWCRAALASVPAPTDEATR